MSEPRCHGDTVTLRLYLWPYAQRPSTSSSLQQLVESQQPFGGELPVTPTHCVRPAGLRGRPATILAGGWIQWQTSLWCGLGSDDGPSTKPSHSSGFSRLCRRRHCRHGHGNDLSNATMPAFTASGRLGHRWMIACRSGSIGAFSCSTAAPGAARSDLT